MVGRAGVIGKGWGVVGRIGVVGKGWDGGQGVGRWAGLVIGKGWSSR